MPTDDNSVNIETQGNRYHHGDLQAALIEEGLAQISKRPAEKLSLREISRKVGVSATAVYRHFPNKAALLGALCQVGSEKLSDTFARATEKPAAEWTRLKPWAEPMSASPWPIPRSSD